MGITRHVAGAIVNAHKNQPIGGKVLTCGRQSVSLTPQQAENLIRAHGLEPRLAAEDCELDRETRIGGEGKATREGAFITDRSFFGMLGVETVEFLDHSDYEGAGLIVDLNEPIPPALESGYDFIIDGGTLDNVFNPPQAVMNLSRMLKPGGRLLAYNFYANFGATYTNLPHQWYLDYFALNRFAFAQTYFTVSDGPKGAISVYQANLAKRAASRKTVLNFPAGDPATGIGLMVYALKAADSTWARQPSQECYRSDGEWQEVSPMFARFAAHKLHPPIQKSSATMPIVMPGRDDFEYLDVEGNPVTEANRETHYARLRRNVLSAMTALDARQGEKPWGIFETESMFFKLLNESPQARAIVAKANVNLFDVRMLNQSTVVDGARKTIHPGTSALVANMPILVICTEPQVDIMWKRLSRMFRHLQLYAGCMEPDGDQGPVNYFSFGGVYLSPSLESGLYKGYSTLLPEFSGESPQEPVLHAAVPGHP